MERDKAIHGIYKRFLQEYRLGQHRLEVECSNSCYATHHNIGGTVVTAEGETVTDALKRLAEITYDTHGELPGVDTSPIEECI